MSAALFAVTIDRARLLDPARSALRLPEGATVVSVLESGRLGCVDVFIALTGPGEGATRPPPPPAELGA